MSIILAVFLTWFLFKTRKGLNLRAVGEDPAAADAAGINVIKYKYAATCSGAVISGMGGLYFVMEYLGGIWQNNGFGDRGWLAIALVILALWKPARAIWGCILFGGLYILFAYVPFGEAAQEIFKMLPYVVTILVLIISVSYTHLDVYKRQGSLLGAEQHGHMETVGYDMYCKLLDEAVCKLKGIEKEESFETSVDINVNAYIPEYYIENEEQRLEIYKKISVINDVDGFYDVQEEIEEMCIRDRYLPMIRQAMRRVRLRALWKYWTGWERT